MSKKEAPLPQPKPWIRTSAEIIDQAQTMMSEAK
jgi:hypothetical protein